MKRSDCLTGIWVSMLVLTAPAAAQEYVEGVNDHLPVDDRWTASADYEQAFRWTPTNSFDLIEIRWHCTFIPSGVIRVREDTGAQPGQVLRQVAFSSAREGWNGAPFSQALPVVSGNTYFVTFQCLGSEYQKFIAQAGQGEQILTYYWTGNDGQSWNGPFTFAGRRMIKFYEPGSACDPCDTNCDGSVNGFDIQSFVDILSVGGPSPCSPCAADTNGDGSVNGFDIQGFVECLGG